MVKVYNVSSVDFSKVVFSKPIKGSDGKYFVASQVRDDDESPSYELMIQFGTKVSLTNGLGDQENSKVHTSTVEAIKLKSTSFEDLQPDHFNGSFMLNELTERYSNQFPPETYAIGRDYNTMEKRLNVTEPFLFGFFFLESLSIDFRA